jgi:hypothetical protein
MPFKDPAKAKEHAKNYRRAKRVEQARVHPVAIPVETRLRCAADVIRLLEQQVGAVLGDTTLGTTERARTIGYLASVSLRSIEAGNLAARIEALESVLKNREKGERS